MKLELLGLSDNEQKAYLTLTDLGKSSAPQVSKESGVPYAKIYGVLAKLQRKNFVHLIPGKIKSFVAADPSQLMDTLRNKRLELDELENQMSELRQRYTLEGDEPIIIASGKKNFYKLMNQAPAARSFDYTIKYSAEFQPSWVQSAKKALKRKIDIKTLYRVDKETALNIKKWHKALKESEGKVIRNKGVAMVISDEYVSFTLLNKNVTAMVYDSAFSDLLRQLYEGYYGSAKESAEAIKRYN
jgi:sugar-specific transcriptional regulator TrmB